MPAPAAKPAEQPTHTPGPWVLTDAFGRENPEGPFIGPSGASPIASLTGYYGVAGRCQNGALLVAAPDVLEALQAVEEWWLREGMHAFTGAPYAIFAARAAIAKATGAA